VLDELFERQVSGLGSVRLFKEELDLIWRDMRIAEVLQTKRKFLCINATIMISVQLVEEALKSAGTFPSSLS